VHSVNVQPSAACHGRANNAVTASGRAALAAAARSPAIHAA
jgi:hypothetical protein